MKILDDPSPTPPKQEFSPEFCSFIDACLQKDPDARPTADQVGKTEMSYIYQSSTLLK
jgi:serine/threonine protein kinase